MTYDQADQDQTVIVDADDPVFSAPTRDTDRDQPPVAFVIRWTDEDRKALRVASLRYASKVLMRLGDTRGAMRIELYLRTLKDGAPEALTEFEI